MTDRPPDSRRDPHRDLAGVLHDVSNALTVMLGWVGEARAPGAAPEAVSYALTIVEQRARIARDLARHAIGAPRIDEQRPAGAIVQEVAAALRVEAQRIGAQVIVSGDDATAKVAGSLDVAQVLTNLVMNAIAYSPRGGKVEIALSVDDAAMTIVVADEGPGVEPARRESIFEGDTTRPGGTGVGLRHSRALARAWGGDVVLVPRRAAAPAATPGASFRVTWPRADAMPRPPMSSARLTDFSGVRVLVVEDDAAVTQLLEAALEARGAAVTIATTADALKAALENHTFDAALVDLSPIAADPGGAVASVRARCPDAPVILVTGNADRMPDSIATSSVELVRKPFEVREVLSVLGARLAKRA